MGATQGVFMVTHRSMVSALVLLLCSACVTTPEQSADVEFYAPKVYRTGSNIAVKDYAGANVEVTKPDASVAAGYLKRCLQPVAGSLPGC